VFEQFLSLLETTSTGWMNIHPQAHDQRGTGNE
jgi:hypothetical protein